MFFMFLNLFDKFIMLYNTAQLSFFLLDDNLMKVTVYYLVTVHAYHNFQHPSIYLLSCKEYTNDMLF